LKEADRQTLLDRLQKIEDLELKNALLRLGDGVIRRSYRS
jgi:hypothetical protein